MSEASWTYLLFAMEIVGVFGMWQVGEKKWWGWTIVLVYSFPWFVYSVLFNKPGFILMTLLWWGTHFRNMMKWRRQSQEGKHGRARRTEDREVQANLDLL